MRSSAVALACAVAWALVALACAGAAGAGRFQERGTVTHVVDGDTIDVRLARGAVERVRVIGIDTPERGACWASEATAATRRLTQGRAVTLVGDATQATRDRYGRLLAYVSLPGGRDLGYELVGGGFARVYVYDRAFVRPVRVATRAVGWADDTVVGGAVRGTGAETGRLSGWVARTQGGNVQTYLTGLLAGVLLLVAGVVTLVS
jgi:micrococcal nuclease